MKKQVTRSINDERSAELLAKLTALGARPMSLIAGPNDSRMEFFTLNGQVVIVQWFSARFGGYEVYAPIFNGNEIKGTFDALDALATERYATR